MRDADHLILERIARDVHAQKAGVAAEAFSMFLDGAPLADVIFLAGRAYQPSILFDAWCHPRAAERRDEVLDLVAEVWEMSEFPQRAFTPPTLWVDLFREAGYRVDSKPADLPSEPQRLYRGAAIQGRLRRGYSWTLRRELADWFAERCELVGRPAAVWTTIAPPEAFLATIEGRTGEGTIIIDTAGLKISRASNV